MTSYLWSIIVLKCSSITSVLMLFIWNIGWVVLFIFIFVCLFLSPIYYLLNLYIKHWQLSKNQNHAKGYNQEGLISLSFPHHSHTSIFIIFLSIPISNHSLVTNYASCFFFRKFYLHTYIQIHHNIYICI